MNGDSELKKYLIGLYIVGVFLTNSYVKQYRLPEWDKTSLAELNTWYTGVTKRDIDQEKAGNSVACFAASILWPVYVVSCLSDVVVRTNVKVEAPDVLKNL